MALQSDIDALSNWTTQNFMTFNTTKCKFMLISRKRSHYVPTTPLSLNGCILEKVPSFKYLGIMISSDLSWSEHIQRACGKARKIIGLLYRRYYHHADSRTLKGANSKKFWSTVRSLNKSVSSIPTLVHGPVTATTDKEKAELLNSFFCQCFNRSVLPLQPNGTNSALHSDESILCTPEIVNDILLEIDISKATGPDGISGRMLKGTAQSIAIPLCKLFNMSISTGSIPQEWRTSNIVPVHKTASKGLACNYRPISLLCIVSKLLERHMYSKMEEHLNSNNVLSEAQWGFRPLHSAGSALIGPTHHWLKTLESGSSVCSVFFDIKKAFDTVPHSTLLEKIEEIDFHPTIGKWLRSYLTCRKQRTVISGCVSSTGAVLSGVPQGSILGPLLFLLYINDISEVPLNSTIVLYADDMLLYRTVDTPEHMDMLQADVDRVSDWISSHHLTLNVAKTKFMRLTRQRALSQLTPPTIHGVPLEQVSEYTLNNAETENPPVILLNGDPVEKVSEFKYLGVIISDDLCWSKQVAAVVTRSRKILGVIFRKFYPWCDTSTLLKLYTAYVKPHLQYCSFVWDPPLLKDQQALEKVQKFALRMCYKRWSATYPELLGISKLPTLSVERLYSKLCHLYKIKNHLTAFPNILEDMPAPPMHLRNRHNQSLFVPYARTNYFLHSFIPSACRTWNSLPSFIVQSATLQSFKRHIQQFLYSTPT